MDKQSLTEQEERDRIVNIVMHSAMFNAFQDWANGRGLIISPAVTNSQLAGEAPKEDEESFRFIWPKDIG